MESEFKYCRQCAQSVYVKPEKPTYKCNKYGICLYCKAKGKTMDNNEPIPNRCHAKTRYRECYDE